MRKPRTVRVKRVCPVVCELELPNAAVENRQCGKLQALQDTREGAPAVSEEVGEEGGGRTPNTAPSHGQAQVRRGMTWLIPLFSGAESAV